MNRTLAVYGLLILTAFSFLGCEDEDDPATTAAVTGVVTREPGSQPLEGVEVVLLRASNLTVAAGPRLTNAEGAYGFSGLEPGRYYLLAFSDPDLILDQTAPTLRIRAGRAVRHDVRLIDSALWDGMGPRVEGTVIDAVTEAPIPGAYASFEIGSEFTIQGLVVPSDAVSDAEGRFVLTELDYGAGGGGMPQSIAPFAVTKEGYLPAIVDGIVLASGDQDTTVVTTVEMTPISAGDGYAVTGTLEDPDGTALEGIRVFLSRSPSDFPVRKKTPMLGHLAVSDAEGVFRFENVPDGSYRIDPAADLDDGWVMNPQGSIDFVVSGEDVDVGPDTVYPAISPISPAPGASVTGTEVTMTWESVADAAFYEVLFSFGHLLEETTVDEPSFTVGLLPAKAIDVTGRWIVRAYDDQESLLAATEGVLTWVVDLPEEE